MKSWTLDDNYTAMGYLRIAIEQYNKYTADNNNYPTITEAQAKKLIGCMHRAFDEYSESEAYDKG